MNNLKKGLIKKYFEEAERVEQASMPVLEATARGSLLGLVSFPVIKVIMGSHPALTDLPKGLVYGAIGGAFANLMAKGSEKNPKLKGFRD